MSAPSNNHARRFHLSEAIARFVSDKGTSHVGRLIGVDRGTVADKGSDLHKWRADEVLILAEHSEDVASALVANVRPADHSAPRAEAVALHSDLMLEAAASAGVSAEISQRLADGTADKADRAAIRSTIIKKRELEDRVLAELDAADGKTP